MKHFRSALFVVGLACLAPATHAAPGPSAEQLLPEETALMVTIPSLTRLQAVYSQLPQSRLWSDPTMNPFRDKFLEKWREEFLKPLERQLRISVSDLDQLFSGQVTLAIIDNASSVPTNATASSFLLMADAGTNAATLARRLADMRRKWSDAGLALRSEKIRDKDFLVVPGSALPAGLKQFLPHAMEFQELGGTEVAAGKRSPDNLLIGQADSLLIVANSPRVTERLLIRLGGGALPVIGDLSGYQTDYQAFFRDAPFYAWANGKRLADLIARTSPTPENPPPSAVDIIRPDKLLSAAGLRAVETVAFTFQHSPDGELMNLFFKVPESSRRGLVSILTGIGKEASPPPFIPADTVRFQRWRLDGKNAWAGFETMMADVSPQWISTIRFILDTANEAAKFKDPGFDIKSNLLGNLGDDLIRIHKAPKGITPTDLAAPPSLVLIGSPNPIQLAAAFKSVLIFMSQQAETPAEREFLGRKIFSVPLPYLPLPVGSSGPPQEPRTLHYAAGASYVAMSTDGSLVEEYLRSADNEVRPLRDLPGLAEAAQRVTGPGLGLFGLHRLSETKRLEFEAVRANPTTANNPLPFSSFPAITGLAAPEKSLRQWMDLSLLPSFASVSKYFYFTVYSASSSADGLTFRWFAPTPPGLHSPEAARN